MVPTAVVGEADVFSEGRAWDLFVEGPTEQEEASEWMDLEG